MLLVQRIIAAFFFHVSSDTEYKVVRIINYTIVRGCSSFRVRPIVSGFSLTFMGHFLHILDNSQNAYITLNIHILAK